jgi:hypothetical protein
VRSEEEEMNTVEKIANAGGRKGIFSPFHWE